ncbi:MAG TPA: Ig-like domain-containing protein [Kofleriaceae bacterium]
MSDPNVGDDGSGDDVVTPPDTTPPSLVSSTVVNDQTKVSVIEKIKFTFSESLDPATIDNSLVKMTSYSNATCWFDGACFSDRPSSTATYDDASKSITVAFDRPLAYGTVYSLELPGTVKDPAGNAFAGTSVSFTTSWNANKKVVYGSNSGATTSQINSFTLDADGRTVKEIDYYGPGTNNIWGDSDDVAGYIRQYIYDHNQISQVRTLGAGTDGKLNTSDDIIAYMDAYTYDHQRIVGISHYTDGGTDGIPGRTTPANGVDDGWGLDHQWGTADDVPVYYYEFTWDGEHIVREAQFSARGLDNAWHTADDRAGSYYKFAYDTNGNRTNFEQWQAGADYMLETTDDKIYYYNTYTYDTHGAVASTTYNYSGSDLIPYNADDQVDEVDRYTLDAKGNRMQEKYYYDAGTDGVVGTADDPVDSIYTHERNADGLETSRYWINSGADGLYDTADDNHSYHYDTSFSGGNRNQYFYFSGAGPDSQWGTADDIYSQRIDYNAD